MYEEFQTDYLKPDEPSVFYACYGSNLMGECFMDYMNPGKHWHAQKLKEDKFESYRVVLPHDLYFAAIEDHEGAAAFLDVDMSGHTLGRIWRISYPQFRTVALLESRADFRELPWDEILNNESTVLDVPGAYGRIQNLGTVDGTPVLTVTSPHDENYHYVNKLFASPHYSYVQVLMSGALETSALELKDIVPFERS